MHKYNKLNGNMVNKQGIDNILDKMDNEVPHPSVQLRTNERKRKEKLCVFFCLTRVLSCLFLLSKEENITLLVLFFALMTYRIRVYCRF